MGATFLMGMGAMGVTLRMNSLFIIKGATYSTSVSGAVAFATIPP